jgi:hypothetical protein
MNEYEEQQLNSFFSLFLDNYTQDLINKNVVNFEVAKSLDVKDAPFAVYSALAAQIVNDLKENEFSDYYISVILKDAYLYTFYKQDANTKPIRDTIENNDIANIAYFLGTNQLLSTAIIKAFINYIFLIKEDLAYKDLLLDEIKKAKKETLLSKFKTEPLNVNSVNYYFKAMLIDKYNSLVKAGTTENGLMIIFDEYFYNDLYIPSENEDKYFNYLRDIPKEEIINEQIRLIYEVAFIILSSNKYDEDADIQEETLNYILKHYNDNPLELPENKKIRWTLYSIFVYYAFDVGPKIEYLSDDNKAVAYQLVPSYFLDMLD